MCCVVLRIDLACFGDGRFDVTNFTIFDDFNQIKLTKLIEHKGELIFSISR